MSTVWTLLITDDCQEDREIYREYLSGDPDQSYQFIEAGSAEAGLALCQKQHCDAILLDFHLPDMTGLEFLDELKQLNTPLPVIMLTGQGDERVAVQAMKRGVQDYLVKQGLEPDMLQLTVRNVLQQSQVQQQFDPRQGQYLTAEVALRLHQSLDLEQILQTVATQVQRVLECDRVVIYQVPSLQDHQLSQDEDRPTLVKRFETGLSGAIHDPIQQFVSLLSENYSPGFQNSPVANLHKPGEPSVVVAKGKKKEIYLLTPILLPPSTPHSPPSVWGLLVACQNSNQRQWQSDEIIFLRDFTRQLAIALQHAEQLTHALEALETEKQLNSVRSQLMATVSHEYRSPLAAILAAASTLKLHSNKLTEIKQQQFLDMIETKARQMAHLVDDLLVLETFEAGKVNFTPMPFELLQFISDLVDEYRQTVGERHELTFKITGNTRGFLGDQKLLRLILSNLLSNAIKYSTEGGAIDVYLVGNETHITIEVKDEGIGIPTEDQAQVLHPFSRGSNVETIPGKGLGLAIVKACVDLHGGKVALKSQEGNGAQFTVYLPKRSLPI